jgi:uncharacterized protein
VHPMWNRTGGAIVLPDTGLHHVRVMKLLLSVILLFCAGAIPGCLTMHFLPVGVGASGPVPPEVELVRFPSTDNLTLEGRLYPASCDRPDFEGAPSNDPRLPDSYKRTIILHCHGVMDNDCSAMAAFFNDAGFRVFQFDYRGFGHSERAPLSNQGFAEDAVAALRYLRSRPDVDPDRIIVYGHSMGAAYALAVGARAWAEGHPVRAVITAGGFSSWRLICNYRVPILGYLCGGVDGPDPVDFASCLGDTPLLITHVEDDGEVPVDNAYRLYHAAAKAGVPVSLHIHPDGGHAFPFWEQLRENTLERVMTDYALVYLADRPPMTPRMRKAMMKNPDEFLKHQTRLNPDAPPPAPAGSAAPGP